MIFITYILETFKKIRAYIFYTFLFLLIFYRERIVIYFIVILTSLRIIYNIDWSFFIENYVMDGSLFLMEGESLGGSEQTQIGSDVFIPYTKDDGTKISSLDPRDWGIDSRHKYTSKRYTYFTHCQQMANLLEYNNKVYGQEYVDTFFDDEGAKNFFETITTRHNIPKAPMSDKLANNLQLRNFFRNQAR